MKPADHVCAECSRKLLFRLCRNKNRISADTEGCTECRHESEGRQKKMPGGVKKYADISCNRPF